MRIRPIELPLQWLISIIKGAADALAAKQVLVQVFREINGYLVHDCILSLDADNMACAVLPKYFTNALRVACLQYNEVNLRYVFLLKQPSEIQSTDINGLSLRCLKDKISVFEEGILGVFMLQSHLWPLESLLVLRFGFAIGLRCFSIIFPVACDMEETYAFKQRVLDALLCCHFAH